MSEVDRAPASEAGSPGVPIQRISVDWAADEPPQDVTCLPRARTHEEDKDERRVTFDWVTDMQRRVGLVVHRMLQQLRAPDQLGFSEETLRGALRCEGLSGTALDEAAARARIALDNIIADRRGRWMLSRHESDEREFGLATAVEGRVKRIIVDRTFVDGGKRWIIDYKTGTHTGGDRDRFLDEEQKRYRSQLEGYAHALQHLDSRPIHLGLYFPMLQGWREWRFVAR